MTAGRRRTATSRWAMRYAVLGTGEVGRTPAGRLLELGTR